MICVASVQLRGSCLCYWRLFIVLIDALVVAIYELLVSVELSRRLRSVLRSLGRVALNILDIILVDETVHPCVSRSTAISICR